MGDINIQSLGRLLGLCRKAGKITTGTEAVMECIRFHKSYLVMIACDASENTAKKLYDSCSYYDAAVVEIPLTMHELSSFTGIKVDCAAAAISDKQLAATVKNKLDSFTDEKRNSSQNMEG